MRLIRISMGFGSDFPRSIARTAFDQVSPVAAHALDAPPRAAKARGVESQPPERSTETEECLRVMPFYAAARRARR